jgi:hypothetical protein
VLVGSIIVTDNVQLDPRVGLGDLLEELAELLVAVARKQASTTLPAATSNAANSVVSLRL